MVGQLTTQSKRRRSFAHQLENVQHSFSVQKLISPDFLGTQIPCLQEQRIKTHRTFLCMSALVEGTELFITTATLIS